VIQEKLGIKHGSITTIHDATGTQKLVDAACAKDLRRGRSGLLNMSPASTGAAKMIGKIFPELKGKLNGMAVRVPILNSSLTDCVFEVSRETTVSHARSRTTVWAGEKVQPGYRRAS